MTIFDLALLVWLTLALIGFAGSALYSGLETGSYTINRVRLHLLDHRGHRAARQLRRLIDQPTALLATLLIGNNVANYLGTASLGVAFSHVGLADWQVIILNTIIVTPILFVFGETLPKDLFAAYADRLMYRLTAVLTASRRFFTVTGLVPLIHGFTAAVMRIIGGPAPLLPLHPRRRVELLVKEGVGYGLLSDEQSAIVQRVLELANRRVRHEMVPWRQVITIGSGDPPRRLWELADRTSRSRFPVVDERGHVVGVVDVARALVHPVEQCPPIHRLMEPPLIPDPDLPLRKALSTLQMRHAAIAVVIDARHRPLGIVTAKDLVEPITGELTTW